jgi:hypothetical protein
MAYASCRILPHSSPLIQLLLLLLLLLLPLLLLLLQVHCGGLWSALPAYRGAA